MHCEYQSFCTVQVLPLTQAVGPVHPDPPHWAYFAAPTALADVVAGQADLETVLMTVAKVAGTEEVLVLTTGAAAEEDDLTTETGAAAEEDVMIETGVADVETTLTGTELVLAFTVEVAALLDETTAATAPTTLGILESSVRFDPVLAIISAGQATCSKSTVGLSEPPNQSKRQSHPGCNLVGKVAQSVSAEIPPYCAPHPLAGAPHSVVQPLKIPTPPPGIARSNWLDPKSPPVLVAWTINVFPTAAPDVNLRA